MNGISKLLISCVLLTAPGCCTIEGWLGWNRYTVGVVANEDANYNGSTNILLIWPSPEKAFELGEIKTYWAAKTWAERMKVEDQCSYTELGDFERGDRTDPLLERPDQIRHCGAKHLFVFTNMEDALAGDGGVINNRAQQLGLEDPGQPASDYIFIHIQHQDFEVKFRESAELMYFDVRKSY